MSFLQVNPSSSFCRFLIAGLFLLAASGTIHAATLYVPAGGDLRAALNQAQPGDEVVLASGATYTDNFVLPVKAGDAFITVRSSRCGELPAGVRVSPEQAPLMATLATPNVMPSLIAPMGSHHWRLQCLQITQGATVGEWGYSLIELGENAAQKTAESVPHHIEIERCYVHTRDAATQAQNGIVLNSAHTTVRDSYVSGIKLRDTETHALVGWNGPGPFTIENNYLEAASINILFGGAAPQIPGLVPSDILIANNTFFKRPEWQGQGYAAKNLLELKNVRRVVISGNLMENNWPEAQTGWAIIINAGSDSGPSNVVEDVTFLNNVIRNTANGINFRGMEATDAATRMRRITVRDNVLDNVGAYGGEGKVFQVLQGSEDVTFDHNTVNGRVHLALIINTVPGFRHVGLAFTNNVIPHGQYGVFGDGGTVGVDAMNTFAYRWMLAGNAFVNAPEWAKLKLPGNYFLSTAAGAVGLLGTDGTQVGARSSSPLPGPTPTPPPAPSPTPTPVASPTPNPLDTAQFFVRQHYVDFLGREPDGPGGTFWQSQITACGGNHICAEAQRVNVSAAFFLSIEFQETGFYVLRAQRAAFGRRSADPSRLSFASFLPETRALGEGVSVGQGDWRGRLALNKQAYAERLVASAEFAARFPETLTAAEYVSALYASAGVTPTQVEVDRAVLAFGPGGTAGRAAALRDVAESGPLTGAEFNAAFVLMQYFGYLRRDPDEAGYQSWLLKLNQFGGDFRRAEIVSAFISSAEYRQRFGQP